MPLYNAICFLSSSPVGCMNWLRCKRHLPKVLAAREAMSHRMATLEGLLFALDHPPQPDEETVGSITEKVNRLRIEAGEKPFKPRKVGAILKKVFDLHPRTGLERSRCPLLSPRRPCGSIQTRHLEAR